MKVRALFSVALFISVAGVSAGAGDAVTHTGWIACNSCAAPRAENSTASSESPRPPNRECAQKCIREGSAVVFYDESLKKLLRVDNPKATEGQESHRVEVTGTIDAAAGTIHVASLKVLEQYVAKCAMPPAEKK